MKTIKILLLTTMLSAFFFTGCDENGFDDTPPSPPTNVWTVTGDNRVDIYWDYNSDRDVAGYNVYYNYEYEGTYTLLGSTTNNYFVDDGAENGVKYYYGVAAYDYDGNESELSYDLVYDTPRPEGFNQAIFDFTSFPGASGYDFSDYLVTAYNSDGADFFFENYNGVYYLNVWAEDTDIQDMGATSDIYDISYAPESGWVPVLGSDNVKYTEAIPGNTYVVWTWDNHYAKIRVRSITSERLVFDWAYQLVEGERELKEQKTERNHVPKVLHKESSKVN